jgi:glycosyltransferase involved in cell wall biosynthesis
MADEYIEGTVRDRADGADKYIRDIPFHVAINAHLLSGRAWYRSAGVHQYIHHLLRYLGQRGADEAGEYARLRYTVLLGEGVLAPDVADGGDKYIPRLPVLRSRWPTSRATVRVVWEQVVQPWVLRRIGADLVHGPAFVGPVLASCPAVVTIHDLSFLRFPALFRPANRLYLAVLTRLSARRARRLIAVSAETASEVTRLLGVPAERIDVVYHGVDPMFRPLPAGEVAAFRQRRGLPERFVLFVGTLEPRKNLVRLVEAFARIRAGADRHSGARLVLAGGKGWLYDELFARVEALGLDEQVIFPGYVASDELPLWYNAATVLAYPSIYEGFGLPVLEAQACGTPVLTSNVSSLPEAAGEAALMVDPYDVEALAAGLHRLLVDEPLRHELREQGLAHAGQFSWPRAAQETARVYWRALCEAPVVGGGRVTAGPGAWASSHSPPTGVGGLPGQAGGEGR